MTSSSTDRHSSPVKPLPPDVARKIAAGEVIDRPASILRELLDNAVDSGATSITAEICGGGIEKVLVSDNGCGMTKEDLEVCAKPHTTSKITAETDLQTLATLGFRGEALASIAAVCRMEIVSKRKTEEHAWKAMMPPAGVGQNRLMPATRSEGTTVQAEALFENVPARRMFLKRPASETSQCRQIFIEKALARTDISFRFIIDGKTKYELPAGQSSQERFIQTFELSEPVSFFEEISAKGRISREYNMPDWSFRLILGSTAVFRSDKRLLLIYVNGRRIQEYSLLQAIEYGATGFFPNGTHPAAVLFLEMKPSLVDFNIHPAKREVRFKDIAEVHHSISTSVRQYYTSTSVPKDTPIEKNVSIQENLNFQDIYTPTHTGTETRLPYELSDHENHYPEGRCNPSSSAANSRYSGSSSYIRELTELALTGNSENNSRKETPSTSAGTQSPVEEPYSFRDAFESDRYRAAGFTQPSPATPVSSDTAFSTNTSISPESAFSEIPAFSPSSPIHPLPENCRNTSSTFTYLGQLFNVFLVAEKEDSLFLIDQHAAHERILFEAFMEKAGQSQPLLIPYVIEPESEQEEVYLESLMPEMNRAGFTLTRSEHKNEHRWEITSVPQKWQGTEADIKDALFKEHKSPAEIIRSIAAYSSCRAAIKEGHFLDRETAENLIAETFKLPDPHCPHGRPLWIQISRDSLYSLIKRT